MVLLSRDLFLGQRLYMYGGLVDTTDPVARRLLLPAFFARQNDVESFCVQASDGAMAGSECEGGDEQTRL